MKDNDIIKALECCRTGTCIDCPNDCGNATCITYLVGDAFDFINRQKVEIESKNRQIDALVSFQRFCENKAIKDFAERLHKEFSQYQREYRKVLNSDGACAMIIAKKAVDDLVKEMTEKGR